ncbi:hypothetical protein ABIA38_009050 [Embleya sp. AB8]
MFVGAGELGRGQQRPGGAGEQQGGDRGGAQRVGQVGGEDVCHAWGDRHGGDAGSAALGEVVGISSRSCRLRNPAWAPRTRAGVCRGRGPGLETVSRDRNSRSSAAAAGSVRGTRRSRSCRLLPDVGGPVLVAGVAGGEQLVLRGLRFPFLDGLVVGPVAARGAGRSAACLRPRLGDRRPDGRGRARSCGFRRIPAGAVAVGRLPAVRDADRTFVRAAVPSTADFRRCRPTAKEPPEGSHRGAVPCRAYGRRGARFTMWSCVVPRRLPGRPGRTIRWPVRRR